MGARSPLLKCAAAGKTACLFMAAMAWRSRYRSLRLAGSVCALGAGLATLLLIAGGIFVMRLSHSPIVINGLGDQIAVALDEKLGRGYHFTLGETAITKRGYGPALGIAGLSLRGADGQMIFAAPYAEVSVDPFSLVIGRVVPKRLRVSDVEIKLSVLPNGSLTVSAGAAPQTPAIVVPSQLPLPADPASDTIATATGNAKVPRAIIIKQAAAAMRLLIDTLTNPDSAIAAIDHVGIERGRLVIDDRTTDETTIFDGLDLAFDKSGSVTDFHLAADGPNGRWRTAVRASGTPGTERQLSIAVENATLDEISLVSGVRSLGVDFDMPVSTQLKVALNPDGTVAEGSGQFKTAPGYFRLDNPDHEPMFIDKLTGKFHWDVATRRILFDTISMKSGGSQFGLVGAVTPPLLEGDPFDFHFHLSEPGVYGAERPGEKPIKVEKGDLAARLFVKDKRFLIDRLNFTGADYGLALAADIDWKNGPHVRMGASIDPTPVRTIIRMWPSLVASPVRAWFLEHFKDGIVQSGTLRTDFDEAALKAMNVDRPPPDDSSSVDFTLVNGSVNFLPGVPPLHDVNGTAHIGGRSTNFQVTNGVLDTESGYRLGMSEGSFRIMDSSIKPTPAVIVARVTGPVEAVRDLLAYDAFKTFASMPIDSNMHGQIDGRLEVHMKIAPPGAQVPEPLILINATASNLTVEKLIGKEKLDNATLSVTVDANGLKASGQGHVFGVPATLELTKPLGPKPAEASLNFTTDDAARAKQGFAAIPGLSGPIGTKINAAFGADKQKAQIELDLSKAAIDGLLPGLSKPAGTPGKASFMLTAADDGMQIDQIVLDMGALQVRGSAELGPDQSLTSAKFSQVRLSPGDDMKVEVNKAGETLKLTVRAATVDARPFLKPFSVASQQAAGGGQAAGAAGGAKESGFFRNIDIDLKCGLVTGFNKRTISNVDLRYVKQNDILRSFALSGHFGREPLSGAMSSGSQMNISSEDAGSLLAFIDLYKHMEGGSLSSSLVLGANDNLSGRLEIKDFTLRDEPAMRRLVAAGIPDATSGKEMPGGGRINADTVPFKKLQVAFQRAGTRLDLRDGVMYGSEIGLTVEGSLDFPRDKVNLNGTFVPAYELNNLFAQIPLFGPLLGGGTNEGLFAINYHITGSPSAPTLNINPLSMMPSAVLRNVFGAIDLSDPNAPRPMPSGGR